MKQKLKFNVTFYLDRWTKDYSYYTLRRLCYIDYMKESINAV